MHVIWPLYYTVREIGLDGLQINNRPKSTKHTSNKISGLNVIVTTTTTMAHRNVWLLEKRNV